MSEPTPARDLPPIITFLTPKERPGVDAVGEGYYHAVHHETIDDVIRDVKSRHVHAILVSVTCAGAHSARTAMLGRDCQRIRAVALLSEIDQNTPKAGTAL